MEAPTGTMAATSSKERSRSERKRSAVEPARRRRRDVPAEARRDRATMTELGADEPGEIRITSVVGAKSTSSTDVRDLTKLFRADGARLWIDLASPSRDEVRIVADALGL